VTRNKLQSYESELCEMLEAKTRTGTKPAQEKQRSFTLTLLLHRWHSDAQPRIVACLRRRLRMGADQVEALACHPFQAPAALAAELMALRDG